MGDEPEGAHDQAAETDSLTGTEGAHGNKSKAPSTKSRAQRPAEHREQRPPSARPLSDRSEFPILKTNHRTEQRNSHPSRVNTAWARASAAEPQTGCGRGMCGFMPRMWSPWKRERASAPALLPVADSRGLLLGTALYSPSSQIALRMVSREAIGEAQWLKLLEERLRERNRAAQADADRRRRMRAGCASARPTSCRVWWWTSTAIW